MRVTKKELRKIIAEELAQQATDGDPDAAYALLTRVGKLARRMKNRGINAEWEALMDAAFVTIASDQYESLDDLITATDKSGRQ